jgi:SRSO17 transposase
VARLGVARAERKRAELMAQIRPHFARIEPRLQAGKYIDALTSDLVKRNGWTIAERIGDRTPDRCQRLLNQAVWDTVAVMGEVRRFAVQGLDLAARGKGLRIGALDETGQQKKGQATAGVKRQHLGCAGGVNNGINTVHLSYGRERTGHALIGARQWIPAEQIADPARSARMGLPAELVFRTKGQLAIDILSDAYTEGVVLDFVCGDEVYGNCTQLRRFLEDRQQGYVLRVPANFVLTLPSGATLTCTQAVRRLAKPKRRWEVRSAGAGSKGARWYAWAWIATTSPHHWLLIRRHLKTAELAFHYCYVPEGQLATKALLIRAAGLRWPVEEDFEFGKDHFGLDQSQVRRYTAILRYTVLVMAALAICAVTAAQLRRQTDTQAPPPTRPDQPPPTDPGRIPLTIPEIKRLLNAATHKPHPPGHTDHWSDYRCRHQARSRWFHQRTRLTKDTNFAQVN